MEMVIVLIVLFCLWSCFWILPVIVGKHRENKERQRHQALADVINAEQTLADNRAGKLLRDLLSEPEYQQLTQHGYLDVASPGHRGRLYRIPIYPGRILVLEHGQPVMELCVRPFMPLPASDVIAVHKLMIEGAEEEYLACANELPLSLTTGLLFRWRGAIS